MLVSDNNGADWNPAKAPGGVFTWINGIAFRLKGKGYSLGAKA